MSNNGDERIDSEEQLSSGSEDEGNDDEWNEMEQDQEPVRCLFCADIVDSVDLAIQHLKAGHQIDLDAIKQKFNMDQYSYIKMINYIRSTNVDATTFLSIDSEVWNDDVYMKPVEVDAWLMFDIDGLKSASVNDVEKSDTHKIEDLQRQLAEKDVLVEHLIGQIQQMKASYQGLIERTDSNGVVTGTPSDGDQVQSYVGQVPIKDDEGYFTTYAHFDIHHDMLSDVVRTSSYRDAILNNKPLFENRVVMDVGCGTSILSMFASNAGAKKVIAVDQSEIIFHAMDIARKNGISNIEFVKGRLENIKLPLADGETVDIIISEWMGYFLLFEGMLDSVIFARDNFLKPGGLMLPNRCNISLVALGDEHRHNEYISFWKNVYGFDMSVMQAEVLKEAIVEVCRNDFVLSEPVVMAEFNVMTVDYKYPNFVYDFELTMKKAGKITAFAGYFDTFFELPQAVHFTTGPHSTPTHWKQVIFYIREPVAVGAGEVVRGQFLCRRGLKDVRALCIQINAFGQSFFYSLN